MDLAKVEQGSYKNRIGHWHNLKLISILIMSKGEKRIVTPALTLLAANRR